MFLVFFLIFFASEGFPNLDNFEYGRALIIFFLPAMATGVWAFYNGKQWSWVRFFLTTLALAVVCFAGLALWLEVICSPSPLPTISFSQKLPSSWLSAENRSITDSLGVSIGNLVVLKNEGKKQAIMIYLRNANGSLKTNAEKWRQNELDCWPIKSGFHVKEEEFGFDTIGGHMVALLRYRVLQTNITYHISGRSWIQGRFFVFCNARSSGADLIDDKEVAGIISSVQIH